MLLLAPDAIDDVVPVSVALADNPVPEPEEADVCEVPSGNTTPPVVVYRVGTVMLDATRVVFATENDTTLSTSLNWRFLDDMIFL